MSVDGNLLRGNIRGKGRVWLKRPNKFLAADRPGRSDITWRTVEDEEPDQISRYQE